MATSAPSGSTKKATRPEQRIAESPGLSAKAVSGSDGAQVFGLLGRVTVAGQRRSCTGLPLRGVHRYAIVRLRVSLTAFRVKSAAQRAQRNPAATARLRAGKDKGDDDHADDPSRHAPFRLGQQRDAGAARGVGRDAGDRSDGLQRRTVHALHQCRRRARPGLRPGQPGERPGLRRGRGTGRRPASGTPGFPGQRLGLDRHDPRLRALGGRFPAAGISRLGLHGGGRRI